MNKLFSRGSEWRKWDLHIHSECGEPEKIIRKIIEENISVFSITDHCNVDRLDTYLELLNKYQKAGNEIYFLPGIELRTDKGDKSVHIIGIFPLKDDKGNNIDSEYLIQNLLSKLDCTRTKIIDAGKEVLGENKQEDEYYSKGLLEKVVNFENASVTIQKLGGIVIVHAGTKSSGIESEMDHARGEEDYETLNSLGHTKRKLMEKHINVCELPNWNATNFKERLFYYNKFNKPSIVTSDSHNIENIGKKYTWIKADPTFEGLKQILNEPMERVYPGYDLPQYKNTANIIDKIEIIDSNKWFETNPIVFNENLISIIGEKGAGKTAIADLISLAAGDFYSEESDITSFVFKALKSTKQIEDTIEDCKVTLYWKNGDKNEIEINPELSNYKRTKKVRYLSQSFIERKCDPEYSQEFQKEIENIIFQHIPTQARMGQTTFEDLKQIRTKSIDIKKSRCKEKLYTLNKEIYELQVEIEKLDSFINEKENLRKEITQIKKQKPKPKTEEETLIEEKLSLSTKRKETLEDSISSSNVKYQKISLVKTSIETLKDQISTKLSLIKSELESIGMENLIDEIKFTISDKFYSKLDKLKKEISNETIKLTGNMNEYNIWKEQNEDLNILTDSYISSFLLKSIEKLINFLESKSSIAEENREVIKKIDKKIETNRKRINELNENINSINTEKKPSLPQKINEREGQYIEYINLLKEEKNILDEIYWPLKEKLNSNEFGGYEKLGFFPRIEFDLDDFFEKSRLLIDFSRTGEYYQDTGRLYKVLKKISEEIELSENLNIFDLIDNLYKSFIVDQNTKLPLKKGKNRLDFYNLIFEVQLFFQLQFQFLYQ